MPDLVRERTKALSSHYESYKCEHKEKALRKRIVKGGGIQYVDQCQGCGRSLSNPISKIKAIELNGGNEPDAFDEEILRHWEEGYEGGAKKIIGDFKSREEFERAEFFSWYNEYLGSPAWEEKRKKVILRANGLCEGCRENSPSEVHHLTYEHVGNEFLFELVALCKPCHERIHPEEVEPSDEEPNDDDEEI